MTFTQAEWSAMADEMGATVADVTLKARRVMTRGEYRVVVDRATNRLSEMMQDRNVPPHSINPILARLQKSFEDRLNALGQSTHRPVGRA